MLANTCAFVDRHALALVVEPIRRDLGATDTQMGLLYGLGFTLVYLGLGVPLARIADRSQRRWMIAAAIMCWSVATAASGLVRSFGGLFIARLAVGAGEAGLSPAAYSLLSDYFPRERLAAALGVYQMGVYVGGGFALVIGGALTTLVPAESSIYIPILGHIRGWQIVFLVLGTPGLVLSGLMLMVHEPVRRGVAGSEAIVPMRAVVTHILSRKRSYFGIGFGFAMMVLVGNATGAWIPTLLAREYGWTIGQIGIRYGAVVFICGTAGALVGGFSATLFEARGWYWGSISPALIGFAALIPVSIVFPLVENAWSSLVLIGLLNFFAGFGFGGGYAAIQRLTPNRMRARTSALYLLLVNAIGGILGPTAVATITDYGFGDPSRLAEAISLTCAVVSPLALLLLTFGARDLQKHPELFG